MIVVKILQDKIFDNVRDKCLICCDAPKGVSHPEHLEHPEGAKCRIKWCTEVDYFLEEIYRETFLFDNARDILKAISSNIGLLQSDVNLFPTLDCLTYRFYHGRFDQFKDNWEGMKRCLNSPNGVPLPFRNFLK